MNKLIFANLFHRPMRSLISIFAVAIEVIMILSVVAIFNGMLNDQKARTNGIGADLMVWPSKASYMNGIGGAPMPAKDVLALRKLPHVTVASPVIQQFITSPSAEVIFGIDYPSFNELKPFTFLTGGPFTGPNDAIVDDVFASSLNPATGHPYQVGDSIVVLGHNLRISGIVEHGKGARKLVPIDTMGSFLGAEGKASVFYVKCDNSANTDLVVQEIRATRGFESFNPQTMDEWDTLMTPEHLPGFNIALNAVTVIAVVVGFLVIFQSMYTAVLERTREIGILKSMGASRFTIVSVVLRECSVIAVVGVLLGIAGTFIVRIIVGHFFPTLHFEITSFWIVKGALIAFVGSVCGALYPAWMAARKDPIDALAYE